MSEKEIMEAIFNELDRAETIWPDWPDNINTQALIMIEEAGEVAKATLHYQFEKGSLQDVKDELIQTAAMCIRMLKKL